MNVVQKLLNQPIKLVQIRIPRSNTAIHRQLPKIKIPFLENDFHLEVFGKAINSNKYILICSNKISSEKAVQDIVIPITNSQSLTGVIIRCKVNNKTQIVLYGYKEDGIENEQEQSKEEQLKILQEKLSKKVSNNFSLTNQLKSNKEYDTEGISLSHEMDQLIHIDSKLLFDNELDENKYMIFSEIKENANKIYQLIQEPILFEQNSNIYFYQKNLEDLSKVISIFVQEKKCSLDQSCLVVNNYKDEVKNLPLLLKEIVLFSIQGSIDFGSEIYHSLLLLRQLMCSESIINSLLDNEQFIKNFFCICFANHKYGNTIQKLFFEILYLFLYYQKFRTGLLSLEESNKDYCYINILRKYLNCFFSIQYEEPIIEIEESILSEISDSSDDKSKRSKNKKDKKSRKDKKKKKSKKSKRKKTKKTKEKTEFDGVLEYEISSVKQFEQAEDRPDKIELKNVYQIMVKKMLTYTQNPLFFNKLRDTNIIMSIVIHIRDLKQQIKKLQNFNDDQQQTKIDFIELIEDINLNLRRIHKNINFVQEFQENFHQLNNSSDQFIKNKNQNVIEDKNIIFQQMQQFAQHEGKVVTEYLANILQGENLLETILLLMNNLVYQKSEIFNQSIQTISDILYGFYISEGGVSFLLRDSKLFQKIQNTFNILSQDKFDFIKEEDFTFLKDQNENTTFGELITVKNVELLANTNKTNLKSFLAQKKQNYFMKRLFQTFRIVNNLYRGFLAPDLQQELLLALIQLSKLQSQSLLAKQAFLFMFKEPYMFETLIQVLKVDDEQMFNHMKEEISITLELMTIIIELDDGKILFKYYTNLIDVLDILEDMMNKYIQLNPYFVHVAKYTILDQNLQKLKNQILPLRKMQENFDRFMFHLQNICRYSIVDIETLMANPENFQYFIDREFPLNNKKKFFARYNVFLQHFRHNDNKTCKLDQIYSYCKIFNYSLKVNSSLFHNLIEENVFDIIDFVVQVAEFIIQVNSYLSEHGNKMRKLYVDQYVEVFEVFLQLLNEGIKVLEKKIQFKNMMVRESQEYENMNLFKSLLRLLCFMTDQNKPHVLTSLFNKILELENLFQEQNFAKRITTTRAHLLKKVQNFSIIKTQNQRQFYLSDKSLSLCNEITDNLVRMFQQWGKFPGSFEPLVLELIFTIFETPLHRDVYFAILSLLMNEPKRIKTLDKIKDNFKKTIKPILFEQVKTKMKSTLVLIQKHGSQKGDSIFDLHVTKNGHTFTINFFLQNFVLTADEDLFVSFYYFIISLIEWKEQSFLNQIFFALEDLLFVKLNEKLEKTIKHSKSSSKILVYFKKMTKVLNFIYLLSSSGLFKSLCIYQGFAQKIINLLNEYQNNQAVQELYMDVFQILKIQILNIIQIFMDPEIGFGYQKKQFSKSNKYFQEVLKKSDAELLIQQYLKDSFDENQLVPILDNNLQDEQQKTIIMKNLIILEQILKSQKMENLILYSTLTSSKSYKDKITPMVNLRKFLNKIMNHLLKIEDKSKFNEFSVMLLLQILKILLFSMSDLENLQLLEIKVRKKAVRKIFFGHRDDQKKFFKDCQQIVDNLNKSLDNSEVLFQINFIIKQLTELFKKKSSKEDDKFNVNSDQQNLKQLLTTYTKGYFKYKKVLQTYHQTYLRRLYFENFFIYLDDMLVNKFERISLQKNFAKKSFLNQNINVSQKDQSDYFNDFYLYELAYFNDKVVYPEEDTIVQENLNVLKKCEISKDANVFVKVYNQLKKLYIEDLLQRNMDIIANKIQSKEQNENIIPVIQNKEDIENVQQNQVLPPEQQFDPSIDQQQNAMNQYQNIQYQQPDMMQHPIDYQQGNYSQMGQVYQPNLYNGTQQFQQMYDPNMMTQEQYQQYMQQMYQQQMPAYYAYPPNGQSDVNYVNDPNYQQQYQNMLMQQQMQQQQQMYYGNGVQQYAPPQDYYPKQDDQNEK